MSDYFLEDGGMRLGPFSGDQIREMAATGQIHLDSIIWSERESRSTLAANIKGLTFGTVSSEIEHPTDKRPKEKKRDRKIKHLGRSGLLTSWLALLIFCNGASALQGTSTTVMLFYAQQVVSEAAPDEFDNPGDREATLSALSPTIWWSVSYLMARCACIASVVWLFQWRKLAFWCLCVAVTLLFFLNLWGGASMMEASPDLIGLAGLIAILQLEEPAAWKSLR